MSELEKRVNAVQAAYDDAPPYRDLEIAEVLEALVKSSEEFVDSQDGGFGFNAVPSSTIRAIAEKLKEDHDDY